MRLNNNDFQASNQIETVKSPADNRNNAGVDSTDPVVQITPPQETQSLRANQGKPREALFQVVSLLN